VLACERRAVPGAADGQRVVVIAHFTPEVCHGYRLGLPPLPAGQRWTLLINTDDVVYGGSGVSPGPLVVEDVPSDGWPTSVRLTLPPLATVMLVPQAVSEEGQG